MFPVLSQSIQGRCYFGSMDDLSTSRAEGMAAASGRKVSEWEGSAQ